MNSYKRIHFIQSGFIIWFHWREFIIWIHYWKLMRIQCSEFMLLNSVVKYGILWIHCNDFKRIERIITQISVINSWIFLNSQILFHGIIYGLVLKALSRSSLSAKSIQSTQTLVLRKPYSSVKILIALGELEYCCCLRKTNELNLNKSWNQSVLIISKPMSFKKSSKRCWRATRGQLLSLAVSTSLSQLWLPARASEHPTRRWSCLGQGCSQQCQTRLAARPATKKTQRQSPHLALRLSAMEATRWYRLGFQVEDDSGSHDQRGAEQIVLIAR